MVLYKKILKTVGQMPEDAAYRKGVQLVTQERMSIVSTVSRIDLTLSEFSLILQQH